MREWGKKTVLAAVLVVLLIGAGILALTPGPIGSLKVETAKVEQGDLEPAIFGIGTVEARLTYTIGPTQAGRLMAVHVDQGDTVKAGQKLGEMDPVDLEERLKSSDYAIRKARDVISIAGAQVKEAESQNQVAQWSWDRYLELRKQDFVSKESAEIKKNEAIRAQAALEAAKQNLEASRKDLSRIIYEAKALEALRGNLSLTSPVNGLIVSRDAEPGSTIVAGQSVFQMIKPETLWAAVRIDEARSRDLREGLPARIFLRSRQDQVIPGTVSRIEIRSDTVTEERLVNVAFAQPLSPITLGEQAEVIIQFPSVPKALYVPSAAVKKVNLQEGVWKAVGGRSRFFPVTTGIKTLDGKTQILKGLQAGEIIIVYSPRMLQEGMRVRPQKQP
ncbi:MAG: efflux RND transporter periplasmic adaptor subunit [Deltaproteobacteria bacterium]|nr:efflux RND transporter periplasmic adaptor subunit [Deltaproteobacteria bacterium]